MRVIDIKTESEVAVTFPYFSMRPWKLRTALNESARLAAPPNLGDGTVFDLYASGYFAFFVVNELTHSENPPPPVYINAFVSGGEDFQVAFPTTEKLDANSFSPTVEEVDEEMEPETFMRDEMRLADYTPMFEYSTIPDNKITVPEVPMTINEVVSRYHLEIPTTESGLWIFNRFSSIFATFSVNAPFWIGLSQFTDSEEVILMLSLQIWMMDLSQILSSQRYKLRDLEKMQENKHLGYRNP
jgi:hypothetical protein